MAKTEALRNLPVTFPDDLKPVIDETARERETSMNDLVVGLIAGNYGLKYEGSGRKGSGPRGGRTTLLRMPGRVYERLHMESARTRVSKEGIVERIVRTALA